MILGIDEVGRGPLAGPLVVGGVILKDATADWCAELTDSKKLTAKKRTELAKLILQNASATALGWVSSRELDAIGMSKALRLAVQRVVTNIQAQKVPFTEIIIDGTVNFLSDTPLENYTTTLKKADFLIKEVSAASIIAKVARDEYMVNLAEKYPGYGFEKHVGYGTAAHLSALQNLGPCSEHRTSFAPVARMSILQGHPEATAEVKQPSPVTTGARNAGLAKYSSSFVGREAEGIVADYLRSHGHTIVSRNHKTKFYEIDIISTLGSTIYFTEVKYRQSQSRGTSLEMINKKKLDQMRFAAEAFLKFQPHLKNNFSPVLAAAAVSGEDFQLDEWLPLVG